MVMRRLLFVVLTAALVASPIALGQGQGQDDVRIDADPAVITFGQSATISGMVRAGGRSGEQVDLQAKPAGSNSFSTVATATAGSGGRYSFTVKPTANTRYRAVASRVSPPATSDEVEVQVRFRVSLRLSDYTPSRCERVRFSGSVQPPHDGRLVFIQRKTVSGAFRGVARTTLKDAGSARSAYSRRVRVCRDGTFRARVVRDADHATGDSRERSANVP
jgi:hypothetical protein